MHSFGVKRLHFETIFDTIFPVCLCSGNENQTKQSRNRTATIMVFLSLMIQWLIYTCFANKSVECLIQLTHS